MEKRKKKFKEWVARVKSRETKLRLWLLIVLMVAVGGTVGGVIIWQQASEEQKDIPEVGEELLENGEEAIVYKYYTDIPTYHIATLAVKLGKGERLGARLTIWKAHKDQPRIGQYGALLFYISDPYHRRIIDAGRIEGVYEFSFTAEVSGDYKLNFIDREGHCVIRMEHNSPALLRDISQ